MSNLDPATVRSFGSEWDRHDQSRLDDAEAARMFDAYFSIFPWEELPPDARGFDMGCGSGRWARQVAPRVGHLTCIDPSELALAAARRTLGGQANVDFVLASTEGGALPEGSADFGYSLGVLHHIPDTRRALADCVRLLRPGAPFLLYLYYRFDDRPAWFRALWRASDGVRRVVSSLPERPKGWVTDALAATAYWPLARAARLAERLGRDPSAMPLSHYRSLSFFTMRTDSRDRFGTPLEQRFTKVEMAAMMEEAGLADLRFSEREPFWVAVGRKRPG